MPEETAVALGFLAETRDGILTLTLDSAGTANALAPAMVEGLIAALDNAGDVRMGVLRGNGRHFCTGFDLSGLETMSDGDLLWRFLRIEILLQKVYRAPFPMVALAQGQVVGAGADLFAACWQRIATGSAAFRMPGWNFELALGTRRLAQRVGADAARDILIDSRHVLAEEARQVGLVSQIAEAEEWDAITGRLAARAAALPPFAATEMLRLTGGDTDDLDLAAVVRTAGRPGLKNRILAYRTAMVEAKQAARK